MPHFRRVLKGERTQKTRWKKACQEREKGCSDLEMGKQVAHSETFEQIVYLEPKDQERKTSEANLKK